jgi:flagellar biosynthetic protein FliR
MGWVAGLVFEAVRAGGALLATEMGLNMANQVDPVTRTSQPLLSHLFQAMALVLFFAAGGHGLVLGALVRSFEAVPPGTFTPRPALALALVSCTGDLMEAALRIAGPVFVLLVALSVCVAFLAKVAPALNILEASYPVRILGTLVLLVLFLPAMMRAFDDLLAAAGRRLIEVAEGCG